ncbi:hypothetical protein TCDM_10669 [Trypanosoma cruzi Dm28c]|uniref:Uncharacterized protein n=1 Tax=Trypanosoma cruzi Dm28c TaxID=1416333 RepID=V5BBG2_TRYCR|nr:hypothetical protein TCDM_10669 [Trypanosoma cruzi Dm28c]
MHDTPTTVCVDACLCAGACTLEPFVAASCVLYLVFLLFFTFFFLCCCCLFIVCFSCCLHTSGRGEFFYLLMPYFL